MAGMGSLDGLSEMPEEQKNILLGKIEEMQVRDRCVSLGSMPCSKQH